MEDPIYHSLLDFALKSLSRRDHTVSELKGKLKKRRPYSVAAEERVVQRLKELNYLNDKAYVERAIQTLPFKKMGPKKLAYKLAQKGLSQALVKNALESADIDENQLAQASLSKIQSKLKTLSPEKRYEKVYRYLMGRGFSHGVAFELAKNNKIY